MSFRQLRITLATEPFRAEGQNKSVWKVTAWPLSKVLADEAASRALPGLPAAPPPITVRGGSSIPRNRFLELSHSLSHKHTHPHALTHTQFLSL
eukprot:6183092-Pleurochrysis_carterae.AAC.2